MSGEKDFQGRLLEIFQAEAREHRQAIVTGLLEIEKGQSPSERVAQVVETVFREAHSLKGAARAVGMTGIESLCQPLESILSIIKKGQGKLQPGMYDTLYRVMDLIQGLEGSPGAGTADPEALRQLDELRRAMESGATKERGLPDLPAVPPPAAPTVNDRGDTKPLPSASETIRISSARLGSVYLKAEELLSVKEAVKRRDVELGELAILQQANTSRWEGVLSRARDLQRAIRALSSTQGDGLKAEADEVIGILEWLHSHASDVGTAIGALSKAAERDDSSTSELVDTLLKEFQALLMYPFASLLEIFPRMVRDLAREEAKQVALEVAGEEVEIDRRILEGIKDPLIHMVRNCISHGIEKPDARAARGKPPEGRVTLRVAQLGSSRVEITLRDDGAGVDLAAVKAAAVKRGLLRAEDAGSIDDEKALSLIFLSEVSTSPLITDLAGRGLGLAIAREKIESLGGVLSVMSTTGEGTEFRIHLPLSLSTFRGVIVRAGGQRFVLPTKSVESVRRVDRSLVASVGASASITVDGRAISFVSLSGVLGLAEVTDGQPAAVPAVVLHAAGIRAAFAVEEVLGEQQVLVKNLGRHLARVRNVSGATVLEGGTVVPILNPSDLLASAARIRTGHAVPSSRAAEPKKRRILIAEDSATSRVMLQSILESAGYEVATSVDGAEAFASLCTNPFDLLVSDVDMPRMNGFVLTERIRGHKGLADLPIVLVTSMDSREDLERGVEAGANAYIVKSSFDQGSLLETIGRLL